MQQRNRPYTILDDRTLLSSTWHAVRLLVIGCAASSVLGAEPVADAPAGTAMSSRSVYRLPSPLEDISGNLRDLEREGFFSITDVRLEKNVANLDAEAIVWTLKVNRPITCRFAIYFFNQLRDVRFVRIAERPLRQDVKPTMVEVHATLLYYDDRIVTGAANSLMVAKDQFVDVWIFMSREDIQRIVNEKATDVVFSYARR